MILVGPILEQVGPVQLELLEQPDKEVVDAPLE